MPSSAVTDPADGGRASFTFTLARFEDNDLLSVAYSLAGPASTQAVPPIT